MDVNQFKQFVEEHTWEGKDVFFTSNALGGELGEVQNVLKKVEAFNDFPNYRDKVIQRVALGKPNFKEMFVDECGDVLFYYFQMLNKENVTLQEVIDMQVEKITKQSESHGRPYKK